MAAATQYSYDFQNTIRDVMDAYEVARLSQPTLISLVTVGQPALHTKHEWLEQATSATTTTIASFATDGTGTGITVASAAHLRVGDILRFEAAAGAARSELVRVTAIATNALTVTRTYGSSPSVTLVVGDVVILQARPKAEATNTGTIDANEQADVAFNYTQIIDRVAAVGATSLALKQYGVGDLVNQQVGFKLNDILREQNQGLIYGYKTLRTGSIEGTAGGIRQFLAGGNTVTTGGALTAAHINDALRLIFDDGGQSNNYALLCSPSQAQRISAFNTSGTNPVVQTTRDDHQTGGYISSFMGNLPVQDGFMAKVVVEPNAPRDAVYVLDMNNIEMNYLRPLQDMDATLPGYDGVMRRILGEFTYTIRQGQRFHAAITGLNV